MKYKPKQNILLCKEATGLDRLSTGKITEVKKDKDKEIYTILCYGKTATGEWEISLSDTKLFITRPKFLDGKTIQDKAVEIAREITNKDCCIENILMENAAIQMADWISQQFFKEMADNEKLEQIMKLNNHEE